MKDAGAGWRLPRGSGRAKRERRKARRASPRGPRWVRQKSVRAERMAGGTAATEERRRVRGQIRCRRSDRDSWAALGEAREPIEIFAIAPRQRVAREKPIERAA